MPYLRHFLSLKWGGGGGGRLKSSQIAKNTTMLVFPLAFHLLSYLVTGISHFM